MSPILSPHRVQIGDIQKGRVTLMDSDRLRGNLFLITCLIVLMLAVHQLKHMFLESRASRRPGQEVRASSTRKRPVLAGQDRLSGGALAFAKQNQALLTMKAI